MDVTKGPTHRPTTDRPAPPAIATSLLQRLLPLLRLLLHEPYAPTQ